MALFPKEITTGAIYLIRNPLDVAVSFAHHENSTVDEIIDRMGSDTYTLLDAPDRLYPHFRQKLLSWSGHVRSWIEYSPHNVHVVRYEDLLQRPLAPVTALLRYTGVAVDDSRLQEAIEFSRFERLQMQEAERGFAEKQPTAPSFFRQGTAGAWRERLSSGQLQRLVRAHQCIMARFGYLSAFE